MQEAAHKEEQLQLVVTETESLVEQVRSRLLFSCSPSFPTKRMRDKQLASCGIELLYTYIYIYKSLPPSIVL